MNAQTTGGARGGARKRLKTGSLALPVQRMRKRLGELKSTIQRYLTANGQLVVHLRLVFLGLSHPRGLQPRRLWGPGQIGPPCS